MLLGDVTTNSHDGMRRRLTRAGKNTANPGSPVGRACGTKDREVLDRQVISPELIQRPIQKDTGRALPNTQIQSLCLETEPIMPQIPCRHHRR